METSLSSTATIEFHALTAPERRLLLELLAAERCGEETLDVIGLGRDRVARRLCEHFMSEWISPREIVFTAYGRHLAETLVLRLVHAKHTLAC
jgi:hypothetical protein